MEQYLMWPKQKLSLSTYLQPSTNPNLYGDSWEEQAFAEDAAGVLGECVWPPRSYSCRFCRREFRSAQALGGHMNVHRRDRARLKLSPNITHDHENLIHQNHHNPIPNHIPSWDAQYPSQIHTVVYNPNPDSDRVLFVPPSSISRVSSPTKLENSKQKSFVPLFPSPILNEHEEKPSLYSPPSWPKLVGHKYSRIKEVNEQVKNSIFFGSNRSKEDYVTGDLSISLNLVVHRTPLTSSVAMEEETISSKRRRIDSTTFPLFSKSDSVDSHEHLQSEVVEGSSSSEEELDLDLRLG